MRLRIRLLVAAGVVGLAASPFLWNLWIRSHYSPDIFQPADVPSARVAIVFGARIHTDGRLSSMLRDRVETAVWLYQAGRVEKLLFSGDNRSEEYDEPGRMMDYALAHGVPAGDMQPDYAGRRTYDTCYRARAIFGVDSAVLVTQEFHLPRALFTCDRLGIEAVGASADLHSYSRRSLGWSYLREIPALLVALIDLVRQVPPPVMGARISID